MSECSRCRNYWPNLECHVCGESLHHNTMTSDNITERAMEEFSTTLWSISNAAVDLSTDITCGDIKPDAAAKKYNKIVTDLRALVETCNEP